MSDPYKWNFYLLKVDSHKILELRKLKVRWFSREVILGESKNSGPRGVVGPIFILNPSTPHSDITAIYPKPPPPSQPSSLSTGWFHRWVGGASASGLMGASPARYDHTPFPLLENEHLYSSPLVCKIEVFSGLVWFCWPTKSWPVDCSECDIWYPWTSCFPKIGYLNNCDERGYYIILY